VPLRSERPSRPLQREFEAVAEAARELIEALRQSNAGFPKDFPQEGLSDLLAGLLRLPDGTAEGGRVQLDHAYLRLNEVRSRYFAFDYGDGPGEETPSPVRKLPLDISLQLLIASAGTALATANREAGEQRSSLQPTEFVGWMEADINTPEAISEADSLEKSLTACRERGRETLRPSSNNTDLLNRRVSDAERLTQSAKAELKFETTVPSWIQKLANALRQTPKLIEAAADAIDVAVDVISPFHDQWLRLKEDLFDLAKTNLPIFTGNLRSAAKKLDKAFGQQIPINDEIDLQLVHEMILRGEMPPPAWQSKIKVLSFARSELANLSPLVGLSALVSLDLNSTPVKDFFDLAHLVSLEVLDLSGTELRSLSPLSVLDKLRTLNISGTAVRELEPLGNLTKLRSLHVGATSVRHAEVLAKLKSLRALSLNGTGIRNLAPLANLKGLDSLDISSVPISDIAAIGECASLQTLRLSRTFIKEIEGLAKLSMLRSLSLNNTSVADLSGLAGLTHLKELDISSTRVKELTELHGLRDLEKLNLTRTAVKDVSVFRDHKTELEILVDSEFFKSRLAKTVVPGSPVRIVVKRAVG